MTLYELTGAFLDLQDSAESDDMDPDVIRDTLDALSMDFDDKADEYAKMIYNLETQAAAVESEIIRLQARKKCLKKNAEKMQCALQNAMQVLGKSKIKTALFSFSICKTPESVNVLDPDAIPEEFWKYQKPVLDKTKIKEAIKKDPEKYKGIAQLTQIEKLRIR